MKYRKLLGILSLIGSLVQSPLTVAAQESSTRNGDWLVECDAEENCIMVTQGEGVVTLIGRDRTDKSLRVVFRIDARAVHRGAATILVNTGWQVSLQVTNCNEDFCEVVVNPAATDQLLAAIKPASIAYLAYQIAVEADAEASVTEQKIAIASFSLSGITKSLNRI